MDADDFTCTKDKVGEGENADPPSGRVLRTKRLVIQLHIFQIGGLVSGVLDVHPLSGKLGRADGSGPVSVLAGRVRLQLRNLQCSHRFVLPERVSSGSAGTCNDANKRDTIGVCMGNGSHHTAMFTVFT